MDDRVEEAVLLYILFANPSQSIPFSHFLVHGVPESTVGSYKLRQLVGRHNRRFKVSLDSLQIDGQDSTNYRVPCEELLQGSDYPQKICPDIRKSSCHVDIIGVPEFH